MSTSMSTSMSTPGALPVSPRARRSLAAIAVAVVASSSACGGGQRTMLTPAQQDDNLQRIEALWAEIERMESGDWYGDDDDDDSPADGDDDGYSPSYGTASAPDVAETEAARPQSMSVARSYTSAASREIRQERESMCHLEDGERQPRCADVCTLAGSICNNAERICHLADELGGDSWADERCAKAVKACKRSDERCCECE